MEDLPDVVAGQAHAAAHNLERLKLNLMDRKIERGVGRPTESVAPRGTIYIDESPNNQGALAWMRLTDEDGNPGDWRVILGDTDWRSIQPATAKLTGALKVKRTEDGVFFSSEGISLSGSGALTDGEVAYHIPLGFLPAMPTIGATFTQQSVFGLWGIGTTTTFAAPTRLASIKWENYPNIPLRLYGPTAATTGKLSFLWPSMFPYGPNAGGEYTWPTSLP